MTLVRSITVYMSIVVLLSILLRILMNIRSTQKKFLPVKIAKFLKKEDNGILTILNLNKRVLIRTTFYTLVKDESFNP